LPPDEEKALPAAVQKGNGDSAEHKKGKRKKMSQMKSGRRKYQGGYHPS